MCTGIFSESLGKGIFKHTDLVIFGEMKMMPILLPKGSKKCGQMPVSSCEKSQTFCMYSVASLECEANKCLVSPNISVFNFL